MQRRQFLKAGTVALAATGASTAGLGTAWARGRGDALRVAPHGDIADDAALVADVAGVPVCVWAATTGGCPSVGGAVDLAQVQALTWLRPGQAPRPVSLRAARRGLILPLAGSPGAGLRVEAAPAALANT